MNTVSLCRTLTLSVLLTLCAAAPSPADDAQVTLVDDGVSRAVIHVPERLWDDPQDTPEPVRSRSKLSSLEDQRRQLRESVRDLAAILERISGAAVEVRVGEPSADDARKAILIGELAEARFGPVGESHPYGQGLRIVVREEAVGFIGESDLATSYAIYTMLHDLGCRWFMPGELGEVLPKMNTIILPVQDVSSGPYTIFRGLWYADAAFMRRNRLGGMPVAAHHALEHTISEDLREKHPEIRAVIGGKPHDTKIKWTHPIVIEAIAETYRKRLKKDPSINSFSLSPMDGIGWDESYDTQHDAGDFDPSTGVVSKTDRIIVMANRIAEAVTADYPDVLFGLLAYVDYTRPPVRETVHPNVVPQIAPITYARAHPMTDDGEPNNAELRRIIEGWGEAASMVSHYFYGWFLAELSAPNPMITKWSIDVPYVLERNGRFWQPETITNFESSMHALYLGMRLAWDPTQEPAAVIDELHRKFYGHAAEEMAAYWHYVDETWVGVPDYSGAGWGYLYRFTPERVNRMRQLLDTAKAAAQTDVEHARIRLADESLTLFERFMQLRRDLAHGRFTNLTADAEAYMQRMNELAERYSDNYTFGKVPYGEFRNLSLVYFDRFYKITYDDAARLARDHDIITDTIREFRYRADENAVGEAERWFAHDHDDSKWQVTDVTRETWSVLGLHNYMGRVWYRATIDLPAVEDGRRVQLWLASTDGSTKLFVNGEHVPYVDRDAQPRDVFRDYARPASFDVSDVIRPGQTNQVTLMCDRVFLNELGTGGLLGPMVVYVEDGDAH